MPYLDVKELSEFINVKPKTIYAWVEKGEIPVVQMNGLRRFDKDKVIRWIDSHTSGETHPVPGRRGRSLDIGDLIARVKREVYNPRPRVSTARTKPHKRGG